MIFYLELSSFLIPWFKELFSSNYTPDYPILVLDARINNFLNKNNDFLWKKYSFYSIDEILNTNQIQIYENMCFPKVNHEEIPNRYKDYQKFLQSNWSFDDFREGPQQEAINALIDNSKDLLLRLPTGGGKSIVFHLPALLRTSYTNRLAVVITPLRALMDDQVKGLWSKGFYESVDFISGGRKHG